MKNETMYFNDLLSIWLEKQKQARLSRQTAKQGTDVLLLLIHTKSGSSQKTMHIDSF